MSFPRPKEERLATGKHYYHVVTEPWLEGNSTILNPWFIMISLVNPPVIDSAEAIEKVVQQIESAAGEIAGKKQGDGYAGGIDAIFLPIHLSDHVHRETLEKFDQEIPVFAVSLAVDKVKAWNHFKHFRTIQNFDPSSTTWDTIHPGSPLPPWLTIFHHPGESFLNLCNTIIWSHDTPSGETVHEAILATPHGLKPSCKSLNAFLASEPKTSKLALMHGLKESHAVGLQNTLGAKGGLELYRHVGDFKYWIPSHDSEMKYQGFFLWLTWTNDTPRTLQWALEEERERTGEERERPNFQRVKNGEAMVLM